MKSIIRQKRSLGVRVLSRMIIKKLIITGVGKKNAEIEFTEGTNIIYGPSNTGKTCILNCIDYLFGSKINPIPREHGYDTIAAQIESSDGFLSISRKLDEKTFLVISQHTKIKSGKYYRTNPHYEKTISYVWLTLIGISDKHMIINNERFERQTLTLRTFIHMFVLNEERIITKNSVFFSGYATSATAEISAFLFLLTGDNYSEFDEREGKKVQEIRQAAIISYIYKEISQYSSERLELMKQLQEQFSDGSDIDIELKINQIMTEMSDTEQNITDALNSNRELLHSIQEINIKISECELLLNRYLNLMSQYNVDLERLNFIVDSAINIPEESTSICPICDHEIESNVSPTIIEAAKSEYNSIKSQVEELKSTIAFVQKEKEKYDFRALELKQKQNHTDVILKTKLKPKMETLKEQLDAYKNYSRYKNEIDFLKDIAQKKQTEVLVVATEEESDQSKYKPREKITSSQIKDISDTIYNFFNKCKFDGLTTAGLDTGSMDVVVNGKLKSEYGKGYRAFLNTIYSLSMLLHLSSYGTYSPGFAMYDSPILSLKERDDQPASSSMKKSLFRMFDGGFDGIQSIIIENELPEIEYKNAHLIHFTKDLENGRYGLLYDVT